MSSISHAPNVGVSSSATPLNGSPSISAPEAGLARANGTNGHAKPFHSHLQLPHEALLLIFQFLHEQHNSYLHPCMLVCKTWRKLILNEPRFWYRLHLDLDNPEQAKNKAIIHASHCFHRDAVFSQALPSTPSPQSTNSTDTGQPPPLPLSSASAGPQLLTSLLDLSFTYLNRKRLDKKTRQSFHLRLRNTTDTILRAIQMHLFDLSSLSIHVVGDDEELLKLVFEILLVQISRAVLLSIRNMKDFPRLCSARHISLDLPSMHGLPLAQHCLAYFEGAHSVTIRGNRPLQGDYVFEPDKPEDPPPFVARIMELQAANATIPNLPEKVIVQYRTYQAALRRYQADLAEYHTYLRLHALDWELFHLPTIRYVSNGQPPALGGEIDVKTHCGFHNLTSLTLFGCTISDNLVLSQDGFPNLRHLIISDCKWGKGLWAFLKASPNLEKLDIHCLFWNKPDPAEELIEEIGDDGPASPTSTLANDDNSEPFGGPQDRRVQTPEDLLDDETPPYIGPGHPREPAVETNYILENSFIIMLGDDSEAIWDFDEDPENEDIDAAYNEIIDSLSDWCKRETVRSYSEELCYPPEIDTGSSWTIVTKPIHRKSWKKEAGFNYHHRVITHFDDRPFQEDDIVSEYDWVTLQQRRWIEREQHDDMSDSSSEFHPDRRPVRSSTEQAPPAILLTKLQSFNFTGGTYEPIWTSVISKSSIRSQHPALSMPNLKKISLSGDRSLSYARLARPVSQVHQVALNIDSDGTKKSAQKFKRPTHITSEEYNEALYLLEEGTTEVPGEPTDEELYKMMSNEEARYYALQPWKLHEYRHEWRVNKGLFTEDGAADDRALLALMTGASRIEPMPYAGTALAATTPHLTALDLSYTAISAAVFQSMTQYLGQLQELFLAGVLTLRDLDLQSLAYTCPRLVFLDISNCGICLTARAAAFVVDKIKHNPRNTSRMSKIKVDDPRTIIWPVQLSIKHVELTCYLYLEFLGLLVDEEVESWLEAMRSGSPFSKKPGKQRLQYRYA